MRKVFVIRSPKCNGCQSCVEACRAEYRDPPGVQRIWVKTVEKGPSALRFHQVNLCCHCTRAPCVDICPTATLYKRPDGIVAFRSVRCLGCGLCRQACPFDAISLDPLSMTAVKCDACASRVDSGAEPACVAACPEGALHFGDRDDPAGAVGLLGSQEPTRVRRPEQGTSPACLYIGSEEAAITPRAARSLEFTPIDPLVEIPGARVVQDVAHGQIWDWQVPVGVWIATLTLGILVVPGIATGIGQLETSPGRNVVLSFVCLLFGVTALGLLAWSMGHSERFVRVLLRPHLRSWATRTAWLFTLFMTLDLIYWILSVLRFQAQAGSLLWPIIAVGQATIVAGAFMSGQCEGRDFWQGPLLPLHMVFQSFLASGAFLALLPVYMGGSPRAAEVSWVAMSIGLGAHLLALLGQSAMRSQSPDVPYAVGLLTRGPWKVAFWVGTILAGGAAPAALLILGKGGGISTGLAAILVLIGLVCHQWCFVHAGQAVSRS